MDMKIMAKDFEKFVLSEGASCAGVVYDEGFFVTQSKINGLDAGDKILSIDGFWLAHGAFNITAAQNMIADMNADGEDGFITLTVKKEKTTCRNQQVQTTISTNTGRTGCIVLVVVLTCWFIRIHTFFYKNQIISCEPS